MERGKDFYAWILNSSWTLDGAMLCPWHLDYARDNIFWDYSQWPNSVPKKVNLEIPNIHVNPDYGLYFGQFVELFYQYSELQI